MANKQHPTRAARSSSPAKSSASLTVDGISLEVQPERPKRGKRKLDGHAASKSSVKRQKASAALGPIKNNDYCESCGLPGRFLCCDACPKAFHFTCVDPPMDDKDVEHLEGEWFCRECQSKRDHTGASSPNAVSPILPGIRGVFDTLTHKLRMQNPKAFKLPKEIWGSFDGVGTDKYGQFVDTSVIKPPKQRVENIDTRPLKDKNGNFMLCFRCRKTALNKRMISCDYCPLHWHLDCTDPPMVAPPNPARKWMCPCHIEHVLPKKRFRKSNQGQRIEIYDDEEKAAIPENEKRKGKRRAVIGPLAQEEMPDHIIPYNKIVYRIPASAIKMDFWLQRLKRAAKTGPAQQRRQQPTNVSRASTSNSSHSLSNSQQRRTVSSLSPAIVPTRSTTTTTVPVPAPVASSSSPSSLQSAMRAPQQPTPAGNSSPIKNKMTKAEAKQWLQNIAKFQAEVAKFIEEEYGPSDDEEAGNAAQP